MQTSQVAKSRADVTGFIFDHQEQVDFHPSDDLLCFLENGKEPVYVKWVNFMRLKPDMLIVF